MLRRKRHNTVAVVRHTTCHGIGVRREPHTSKCKTVHWNTCCATGSLPLGVGPHPSSVVTADDNFQFQDFWCFELSTFAPSCMVLKNPCFFQLAISDFELQMCQMEAWKKRVR